MTYIYKTNKGQKIGPTINGLEEKIILNKIEVPPKIRKNFLKKQWKWIMQWCNGSYDNCFSTLEESQLRSDRLQQNLVEEIESAYWEAMVPQNQYNH